MVSVTSASRYITSASRYHPRYQSRSSMYIRGLIPRNFAELAEAVPIEWHTPEKKECFLILRECLLCILRGFLPDTAERRCGIASSESMEEGEHAGILSPNFVCNGIYSAS